MVLAVRAAPKALMGVTQPRIAPPPPAKSLLKEFEAAATDLGIELMPWQRVAARYMVGLGKGRWRYREVCIVVARQNGKTTLLLPRVVLALRAGHRVLHTAQNREIPLETFEQLADYYTREGGAKILRSTGRESIRLPSTGGRYTIVAPRHGIRGQHADLVIQDEIREQHTDELRRAMLPTTMASQDPQTLYITNAGEADSVVLNELRRRMHEDTVLAYLEWSAAPERLSSDRKGWAEANPALGYVMPIENIEAAHTSQTPAGFETEHLCRWVITMRPRLVSEEDWQLCRKPTGTSLRPAMAISMDPSGKRASAAIAWQPSEDSVAVRVVADVTGDPIDTDRLGRDLSQLAIRCGATQVGFNAYTDADLARHFRKAKAMTDREFCNASESFVRLVESGKLCWEDADQIGEDLAWTARKPHESGAWMAVKAVDDRPATAALAAIRAVWLASGPRPAAPRVM